MAKRLAAVVLLLAMALVAGPVLSRAGEIVYGSQVYVGHGAFQATKTEPSQLAVGGQFNGWALDGALAVGFPSWAFGIATEAIGFGNANPYLIGAENAVVNLNPANLSRKIANNAVFKCRMDNDPPPCPGGPNNFDAIAYWVSAQPESGFDSALKLDRSSIRDSGARHAAVLDLSDLDPAMDYVFVRLPGGREVRFSEFARALDKAKGP